MHVAGHLCGGTGVIKRYMASATMSTVGVPVVGTIISTTDIGNVIIAPKSALMQAMMGITIDTTGTVSATADLADTLVSVDVRPDAIIKTKISGGDAADTALTAQATTSADATGVNANGVTSIVDGSIWGYDGANTGQRSLRISDVVTGSVTISFDSAVASGDTFIVTGQAPGSIGIVAGANAYMDLTANSDQVRGDIAITDTDNFILLEVEARGVADQGTTNSYYLMTSNNHAFGSSTVS